MTTCKSLRLGFLLTAGFGLASANAATVAHWNFDQGINGTPFSTLAAEDLSGNGNTMYGFDAYWGPSYSSVTANGSGLSSRHADNHQDGYTFGSPVNAWSPLAWTIEVSVRLDSVAGWKTIIGRDGTTHGGVESDFYLQNNGINDRWRVNFATVGGLRYVLDTDFIATANQWYGLAVVSDGSLLTMYADKQDGQGYQSVGSLALNALNNNALAASNFNWTFGRGWFNGGFVDHISGYMDNIRFSDTALSPENFIPVPEPSSLALLGLGGLFLLRRRPAR
jgi:hypothetical protein